MIVQPKEVWLAVQPVDMRLGIDGLSQLVQDALNKAPCDGSAYGFRNQRSNRVKLLIWDGAGVWLGARRLHSGRFHWPQGNELICTLNHEKWLLRIIIAASQEQQSWEWNKFGGVAIRA